MNAERLFKTIMMDLSSKQAKLEDEVELIINSSTLTLEEKSKQLQFLLPQLTMTEASIMKFNSMLVVTPPEQNNNTENNEDNGNK